MPTLGTTKLLDRAGAKRPDEAWMSEQRANPLSRFMVLVDLKPVIAPGPDRSSAAAQTVDDELTEALKGTFPGSDPVALESPLVSRAPKDKRS